MKKYDVQVKKVCGDPHSNIHQRSNVTIIKFIIDKIKDGDRRKNKMKNVKLNEDMVHRRKEKRKKEGKIKNQI